MNTSRRPVVLNVALPGVAAELAFPPVLVLVLGRVTAKEKGSAVCSKANWRSPSGARVPADTNNRKWRSGWLVE